MSHYEPATNRRTRVLGVTASPVSEVSMDELVCLMDELLQRLHGQLYVVQGDDPDVEAVVAQPERRELHVARPPLEAQTALLLQDFALRCASDIANALPRLAVPPGPDAAELRGELQLLAGKLHEAVGECGRPAASRNQASALAPVSEWLTKGREFGERCGCPRLLMACAFLDLLRKAVELMEDVGVDGTLPFLARKAAAMAAHEADSLNPLAAVFSGNSSSLGAPAALCGDLPGSLGPTALGRRLLLGGGSGDGLGRLLGRPAWQSVVANCFASGHLQEATTFPKLWALLKFLVEGYGNRAEWKGMLFVRARQAVFCLADHIRRAQQLGFVEVLELVGHGKAAGGGAGMRAHDDGHGRGMDDAQQQRVIAMFKEPGRKLLIATSAAEEGLDVPACEFVVRYNAAATGIQLLQSRGRARVRASVFLAILQTGTLDLHLHGKSNTEEANMKAYLQTLSAAGAAAGGAAGLGLGPPV